MKAYLSLFRMRLIYGLQYRVAALAGVATQFFWGFMFIMIYEAFYQGATQTTPIALNQLVSYIWLQQAFLVFFVLWQRDSELFNLITSGNIAYELCRPTRLYWFWYARLVAQRMSGALLRCLPILFIAFLLPKPYGLSLPPSISAFCLFVLTLILGLLVLVSISMFIYISVFITMSPIGSLLMISVLGDFFSGAIIPIPFMPGWLQKVVYALPFRLAADLPFRVYSGNIPANSIKWNIIKIATLTLMIISGIFVFTGIYVLAATLSFWTIQSIEVANIFTDGGREMSQYPLNIYKKWVTRFFTFVIPFGCVNYLPLMFILDKTEGNGILLMLTPLYGILFIVPCIFVWRFGVRHYRSTGS